MNKLLDALNTVSYVEIKDDDVFYTYRKKEVDTSIEEAKKQEKILELIKAFLKSDETDLFDWCEQFDEVNNTNITKLIEEWLKDESKTSD